MEDIRFSSVAKFQPRQLEAKNAVEAHKYVLFGGEKK